MNGYTNQIAASSNNGFAGAHQFYNNCFGRWILFKSQHYVALNGLIKMKINAMVREFNQNNNYQVNKKTTCVGRHLNYNIT